jgi:iron-sulfur cluster assembly protein CyaY
MIESEFNALADIALARIEQTLEACGAELDWELKAGGVLELEFADGGKIIVNRHSAAREIWVAAKSGGFHYRHDGGRWVNTRDGEELFAALSRLVSTQAGERVELTSG